jgi:hypothetical protein
MATNEWSRFDGVQGIIGVSSNQRKKTRFVGFFHAKKINVQTTLATCVCSLDHIALLSYLNFVPIHCGKVPVT